MSTASVDFPEPETPQSPTSTPSGIATSSPARLFSRGRRMTSSPVGHAPARADRSPPAGRAPSRAAVPATRDGVPCATILPAVASRAGAEDDDLVGARDQLPVVLDEEQRVALVAERDEFVAERVGLCRVEPARRLVEEHRHPGELAAEQRGELEPLRLARGQRRARAVEVDVAEADPSEEAEARAGGCERVGDAGQRWLRKPAGEQALELGERHSVERRAALAARSSTRRYSGRRRSPSHASQRTCSV